MLLCIVLLSFLLLSGKEASRPFDILFVRTNCSVLNYYYASSFVCPIVELPGKSGNYMDVRLNIKRDIYKLLLHFRFKVPRLMSNVSYELFNFKTDGCHLNELSTKNSLLKAVLKKLVQNGNFKRCPMRSNQTFTADRFSLNPDHFPPYTPDMNFTVELDFIVEQSNPMVTIGVDSTIVRKKTKT